jgi:phosphopantothenoylcysteine decarboxylase/phosphopantothenate--cysteine ligase
MVAAVADWAVAPAPQKLKKGAQGPPAIELTETPDILADLAKSPRRPTLLVGFAAETEALIANAEAKLAKKGADLIVANDVSGEVMGGDRNRVHLVSAAGVEALPEGSKDEVARLLAARIAALLDG